MILSYQKRILLTVIIMLMVLLLLIVALWMPSVKRDIQVMDALFVLDITDSMNVEDALLDGQPVSRMHWAKETTRRTIRRMPCGARVGLAVFSESRSLTLMNPIDVCSSYQALTEMLERINPHMAWVRSSEVSKAVYTAIRQAKEIDTNPTVVFITDGHESPPVHETLFPRFSGTPGEIPGLLVGVGGDELLPIPKTNEYGEIDGYWGINEVVHHSVFASRQADDHIPQQRTEHLSSQKASHMQMLADHVGFEFISSPKRTADLLNAMQKVSITRQQRVDYALYPWIAGIALILFLLVYLPYGRSMKTHD